MNRILLTALLLLSFLLSSTANATSYFGARASIALAAKEPPNVRGYQYTFFYDPQTIQWRKFNVYFDTGFSQFWDTKARGYSTVSIYSAAPVVRYTFRRRGPFLPFLELSIGVAYLNHTHLEQRNFGIHFAFQDRAGIGVLIGAAEQISIGVHVVHYSNARLAYNNAGISVPLLLDVGVRF